MDQTLEIKKKIYIPSKWKVAFKLSENLNKKLNEEI
jgi:nucleoid DNA-binding protein